MPDKSDTGTSNSEGLIEVEANGQKFMVPEQMAQAMNAQKSQFEGTMQSLQDKHSQQMTDLTSQVSAKFESMTPVEPEPEVAEDWLTKFYADPRAVLQNIKEEAKEEVKTELRTEYQEQNSAKESEIEFWNQFYNENPDLSEHKFTVESIFRRDLRELNTLLRTDPDKVKTELAERTKAYILSFSNKPSTPTAHTEIPSYSNIPTIPSETEKSSGEKVFTLTDQLKKRADERNKALKKMKLA